MVQLLLLQPVSNTWVNISVIKIHILMKCMNLKNKSVCCFLLCVGVYRCVCMHLYAVMSDGTLCVCVCVIWVCVHVICPTF